LNALRLVDAQFAWIVLSGSEVIDTGVQSDSTVLTTFAADATMGDGFVFVAVFIYKKRIGKLTRLRAAGRRVLWATAERGSLSR
jgi:hypothetical protein